ncbi:hypothetical protein [Agaribacterium haliotis]|uniref:hypothetical protein n=1 Tax=Agaribacterium haliotis TaxID=2013869 RepID=UPI000BB56B4B|nr:hypothetical protein [Agaribacterium haliotis]
MTKKRKVVVPILACLGLGLASVTSAATFNTNFKEGYGQFVSKIDLWFPNEKNGMNVNYQASNIFRNSSVGAYLKAYKDTGNNTRGAWLQTTDKFPNGTVTEARCRVANYGNEVDEKYNWAGYWTLFDRVNELNNPHYYYENDIMETFDNGYFLNRYDYKSLDGLVAGKSNTYTGNSNVNLRRSWRNYKVSYGGSSASFNVQGGASVTHSGIYRAGNHRMIMQNRPWPTSLSSLPNWSTLARIECQWANIQTP